VKPNFWLNGHNGVSYPIVVQMPQYRIDSMSDLDNVPLTSSAAKTPQYLGGLAQISEGPSPGVVSHYNVQPVIDVYASVEGRDLVPLRLTSSTSFTTPAAGCRPARTWRCGGRFRP